MYNLINNTFNQMLNYTHYVFMNKVEIYRVRFLTYTFQ